MSGSPHAGPDEGLSPPAPHTELEGAKAWLALAPLLLGTFIGTLNNNIVNVPMRDIMGSLRVPLAEGVLVIVAFNLTFAALMPLTGWLGDRIGRRLTFCCAVVVLGVGAIGSALSPSLPVLVGFRVIQGAATAAILPTVMSLTAEMFGPVRRGRALGLWASVNGLGQALGPPLGGLLAGIFSWRAIFWPVVPLAAVAALAALRYVPNDQGRRIGFDRQGALSLTLGAGLIIGAAAAVPSFGFRSSAVLALTLAGTGALTIFWRSTSGGRGVAPFVSRKLLREPSFLRSSLAVFAQMFCLGATLLGVSLYLTRGDGGATTLRAGVLVFALPVTMTVLAPAAGLATERLGPRRAIRGGLVVLTLAEVWIGAEFARGASAGPSIVAGLVLAGAGIAFVQTPSAVGATRSAAGRHGSGLGLFNLIRFAGSALGAAWVAIVLSAGEAFGLLFAVCAAAAVLGLVGTFAGPDPQVIPQPDAA